MGRNGLFSNRWKWKLKKSVCSCAFLWKFLFLISFLVYIPLLFLASGRLQCRDSPATAIQTTTNIVSKPYTYQGDLRKLETSWNALTFGSKPSSKRLKIAVFIKKWWRKDRVGGLEHHTQTLYRALTKQGHQVHVFTSISNNPTKIVENDKSMQFHFSNNSDPTNMFVNKEEAWLEFQNIKQILNGFDIIHTESVCLPPKYALGLNNVVATWHGIGYEVIHSYIVQDLSRDPNQARSHDLDQALKEQVEKVIHEINFFPSYKHHVAISDYLGDVLRTVYMLPAESISIIVNGVDEGQFQPNPSKGREFRETHGVPTDAKLVLGMAGRLVKDKGHPLGFRVLREMFLDNQNKNIFVVIVGSGPWASRYAELGPNVKVLGSLISDQLGDFYNSLDICLSPTLRAQGLDLTLVEAMMCGKPLLATHFSSITKSVIVSEEFGYTFSPTFKSLKNGLERVLEDGKEVLEKKGRACRRRASLLFTAQKMAAAYE